MKIEVEIEDSVRPIGNFPETQAGRIERKLASAVERKDDLVAARMELTKQIDQQDEIIELLVYIK